MSKETGEDEHIRILDGELELVLDHAGACYAHDGDSIWGVAVVFRALQVAGAALSDCGLWQREDLRILSAHPGPGVRDAIEYVTGCVSGGRFRLTPLCEGSKTCGRDMRFEWWVSDASRTVHVRLHDDFVPDELFDLIDRRGTPAERTTDAERFTQVKADLVERIWKDPLSVNFSLEMLERPLADNELPEAIAHA